MANQLDEFNNKVIAKLKEQNETDGLFGIDLSDEAVGITRIEINGKPSLVFVKLNKDEENKDKPLVDKIEGIIFTISMDKVEEANRMTKWLNVIASEIATRDYLNLPVDNLVK